jgi:hypothetical protein
MGYWEARAKMNDHLTEETRNEQMYRCFYDDPQGSRRFVDTNKGVWFCKDGFWVDSDWQYAVNLDDCVYWIPPHRIVLLTKLPRGTT